MQMYIIPPKFSLSFSFVNGFGFRQMASKDTQKSHVPKQTHHLIFVEATTNKTRIKAKNYSTTFKSYSTNHNKTRHKSK
jgi:3,4-dihydroxy-2-butanone 4-phosphate synthase